MKQTKVEKQNDDRIMSSKIKDILQQLANAGIEVYDAVGEVEFPNQNTDDAVMDISHEIKQIKGEIAELKKLLTKNTPTEASQPVQKQNQVPCVVGKFYTPSQYRNVVSEEVNNLKFIHNQTHDICMLAVSRNPNTLRFVHEQTFEICQAAIKVAPSALRFVENQTNDLCKLAIHGDPSTIGLVRIPTVELIEYALNQQRGTANHAIVKSVLSLSDEAYDLQYQLFKRLIVKNIGFLAYIPEKYRTVELVKLAIDEDVSAISLLVDQAPVIKYAVDKSWKALAYIRKPTPEMYNYALGKYGERVTSLNPSGFNHLDPDFIKYFNLLEIDATYAKQFKTYELTLKTK